MRTGSTKHDTQAHGLALPLPTVPAILVIIALFAIVATLRFSFYNPNDGLGLLYCLPIAFTAVRFGPIAGVVSGMAGFAFFLAWAITGPHDGVNPVGFVSRLIVFLVLGGLVGYFARARAELDLRSRLLFDLSPDLMATLDTSGRVVSVNDAWTVAAGRVLNPATFGSDWATRLPDAGRSTTFEQDVQIVGGSRRTIEWFAQRDARRPLLYVVGRDVTERAEQAAHVRRLLGAVQDARASERARISSELHDFVLQQLLVALMHAEREAEANGTTGASGVDRFVRRSISALRGVVDGIQPLDFTHLSCAAVLERASVAVEDEWNVEVAREIDTVASLDEERKLLAYRLAGEALRNAAKHAGADEIRLEASERDGWLDVRVTDDGVGLDEAVDVSDALVPAYGTGFNLLLEHALVTGGRTTVRSVPGEGTTIGFRIPLAARASVAPAG